MSFFSILETLLIGPLKLVFEIIFGVANSFVSHPGIAIIFLSLVMNILVLPLYRRADAMQEEARDVENRLSAGVAHIKKTFSGDERMMILQTYYRQNNYKPTDALNGSVSLLLEIPFFMAAYQFLSHLDILNGVSLGPIKDLGAPDGLIVIGSVAINLLPVLMTLINVISSALYLKGFPLKTKIQLYGMALFFLVFLYTSPSCLVFYWTLNNLFSLVKTIFYKLKNPQLIIRIITTLAGLLFLGYGGFLFGGSAARKAFLLLIGAALLLPALLPLLKKFKKERPAKAEAGNNRRLFVLGCLFLTVLVGLVIPTAYIAASPQEYVDVSYFHNPLWYVVSSAAMAAGFFLVWFGVFYWLANTKGKIIFDKAVWVLCGVMLINYMFFGTNLGIISSTLRYEEGMIFSLAENLINLGVLAAAAAVLLLLISRWKKAVAYILVIAILALGGMSGVNIATINTSVSAITSGETASQIPSFSLSQKGKNVVVIMLDRALAQYVPYIFNEKPELKEQFDGFTNYTNTISFGGFTNFGTPPLLGGYEYTPVEMNKRDTENLVDKHNEALKLMPTVFAQNGYEVTVCDPVYANYQWIPDLSVFEGMEGVNAYISKGKFGDVAQKQSVIDNNRRNFFCFGVMKSMPVALQPAIYNNGMYNQVKTEAEEQVYSSQSMESISVASGLVSSFMESYNVLANMPNMTNVISEERNTFLLLTNDMTHDAQLLQAPDYVPSNQVNNIEYDATHATKEDGYGNTITIENTTQMSHYHANMAALIQLGNWFDYMRENKVYDNTRIIIVADHGRDLGHNEEYLLDDSGFAMMDMGFYQPMLMVKDFGSTGFNMSDEFMTNADVPTLAVADIIENPTNPFTGKAINSNAKTEHEQFIIISNKWGINTNNGTTYQPGVWASVNGSATDRTKWTVYNGEMVLKNHSVN